MNPEPPDDPLSDEETARRRDEVVKRMLDTPPQPHKPKNGREPKLAPNGLTDSAGAPTNC